MLKITPPMSNYERQREFRERNPGYYGRLHRKRKAEMLAAMAAQKVAVEAEQVVAVQVTAVRREPLMLPAPVVIFEIPGVNAIPAGMPLQREYAAVAQSDE
jgi:hypothetical protein